jgi:hypothetical protein
MKRTKRQLTHEEREQRRAEQRAPVKASIEQCRSSDGWRASLRARRTFHNYSASNCMLIALQCHQRGMVPGHIAAYHAWIKLGRAVRKDEQAIRILAPITVKQRDNLSHDAEERRVFFKTTFVFDT